MLNVAVLVGDWEQIEPVEGWETWYLLWDVIQALRERGHRVQTIRGVDRRDWPEADIGVVHVDLTRTPAAYAEAAGRYPVAVNGGCLDISKRAVSSCVVRPGDGYEGPVIVKSDLNCGGHPEEVRGRRSRGWVAKQAGSVGKRMPWAMRRRLPLSAYRVFERRSDVPWVAWRNPGLVVERFLPEERDGLYWLRSWLFMGECGYVRLIGAEERVVKARGIVRQELGDQDDPAWLPPSVRDRRAELGLDYGKIDFVMHKNEAVIFDINRTPSSSRDKSPEERGYQSGLLADGLERMAEAGLQASGLPG
ncbi:MAG: hypothetical protein LAT64_06940 [Phycisphaerales bacterium]|nr:hypothetical protein [Planctomycetota bacterium]MCH8508490.1 hypothetical protein [Phycisphaerales bacterium]